MRYDDTDKDWHQPLTWGLNWEQVKALWPDKSVMWDGDEGKLHFYNKEHWDCATLRNFECDCGAVYITCACYVDEQIMKNILEFCSKSGFSKIFATLVSKNVPNLQLFTDNGFTVVMDGFSNRNPTKRDVVLFKHVDCIHKGY